MSTISVTPEVSKFDKFKEVNDEQSVNNLQIYLTFEVRKLDKSKEVKEEQFLNISYIS